MSTEMRVEKRPTTLRQMLSKGHLRLVLIAVGLATLSLTLTGIHMIRGFAAANSELTARTISYAVEPAVLFDDRTAVQDAVNAVGDVGNFSNIEVRNAAGASLGKWETGFSRYSDKIGPIAKNIIAIDAKSVPIRSGSEVIGTVIVNGSAAALLEYAMSGLLIAAACLGLTIIATRIIARGLEERIVAPLDHVGEIAHRVRSGRQFGQRVSLSGIAEIDRLGRDFNALLGEMQEWHDTLSSENVELARRAEHDPLTGLGNRDRFERLMVQTLERRVIDGGTMAILFLDADEFKSINDNFGHDTGDMVLLTMAERLKQSVRAKDRVFRLGGDEFAILLDGNEAGVTAVMKRIMENMDQPITVALHQECELGVSIGAALYPRDGTTMRALLRVADKRMYEHKRNRQIDA